MARERVFCLTSRDLPSRLQLRHRPRVSRLPQTICAQSHYKAIGTKLLAGDAAVTERSLIPKEMEGTCLPEPMAPKCEMARAIVSSHRACVVC